MPGVKQLIADETFWKHTVGIACLQKAVCTGIEYCEGDSLSVSVLPRIWKHIEAKLDGTSLALYGFDEDVIVPILQAIQNS